MQISIMLTGVVRFLLLQMSRSNGDDRRGGRVSRGRHGEKRRQFRVDQSRGESRRKTRRHDACQGRHCRQRLLTSSNAQTG